MNSFLEVKISELARMFISENELLSESEKSITLMTGQVPEGVISNSTVSKKFPYEYALSALFLV